MTPATPAQPQPTEHATLVFERVVPAPVAAVFEAFANASLRAEWGVPSGDEVIVYDAEHFAEGGEDRLRCGPRQNPNIHVSARYIEIIENQRVVSTETIVMDGRRLCATLSTLELWPEGEATRLKCTTQVASFVGKSMVDGHRSGYAASLDGLVRYFQRRVVEVMGKLEWDTSFDHKAERSRD